MQSHASIKLICKSETLRRRDFRFPSAFLSPKAFGFHSDSHRTSLTNPSSKSFLGWLRISSFSSLSVDITLPSNENRRILLFKYFSASRCQQKSFASNFSMLDAALAARGEKNFSSAICDIENVY
jgi:hypothetical protein